MCRHIMSCFSKNNRRKMIDGDRCRKIFDIFGEKFELFRDVEIVDKKGFEKSTKSRTVGESENREIGDFEGSEKGSKNGIFGVQNSAKFGSKFGSRKSGTRTSKIGHFSEDVNWR